MTTILHAHQFCACIFAAFTAMFCSNMFHFHASFACKSILHLSSFQMHICFSFKSILTSHSSCSHTQIHIEINFACTFILCGCSCHTHINFWFVNLFCIHIQFLLMFISQQCFACASNLCLHSHSIHTHFLLKLISHSCCFFTLRFILHSLLCLDHHGQCGCLSTLCLFGLLSLMNSHFNNCKDERCSHHQATAECDSLQSSILLNWKEM